MKTRFRLFQRASGVFYIEDPERFAQEALGHNSKAVHRAYARKAKVIVPSLEEYELQQANNNLINVNFEAGKAAKFPSGQPIEARAIAE